MANLFTPVTAPAVKPYAIGGLILFLLLVAIPAGVLLPLNTIAMWKTIGLLTIITAFLTWLIGVGPLAVTYSGIVGSIWGVLKKKGFGPGAAKGIETLIKALILATFVFVVEGTVATFVYFGNNTSAYVGLMVIGLASVLLGLQFEIKASMAGWILGGMLTIFAILSVFGIRLAIPAEHNLNTTEIASGASLKGILPSSGDCENLGGILHETSTNFTLRKGCTTYFDAVLMKHGIDEGFYDIRHLDSSLDGHEPGEFIKESEWVQKNGRWLIKLVPNDDAFGDRDSVPMMAYSAKIN